MIPVCYLTTIGLTLLLALPVAAQPSSPAAPSATEKETGKSEPAHGLIDINSASAEELDKLPGVGPVRAQAIISHRPYHGKDDLANRKIIPENVYNEIKDKIIAHQGPTK
jgi:competence protein ComEA